MIVLGICVLPIAASAQEAPPIPHPRIERPDSPTVETPAPGQTSEDAEAGSGDEEGFVDEGAVPSETGFIPHDGPPQPVTLSAKITDEGPILSAGLVWRIFDTKTDESGQLALLAKSNDAAAVFSLPPGEYVVHVAYGKSQASDTIIVDAGPTSKTMVLEAGGLRLHAAIGDDVPIPPSLLYFDIYAGSEADARALVAENVLPGSLVHLNSGVYHVVSRFGRINAVVRADLRVEPGQLTDATLFHKAAQVNFKLVSEAGGEAIADVEWTVKSASGDTLFEEVGAFPSTVLAEGDYVVLAKRGAAVYNRDFSVQPGPAQEIELLTAVY